MIFLIFFVFQEKLTVKPVKEVKVEKKVDEEPDLDIDRDSSVAFVKKISTPNLEI